VIPAVLSEWSARLILRKEVPEQDAVGLRRVLDACPERRACGIRPEVEQLEIPFVLPAKGNSGHSAANREDIELDGSVAEREVSQNGVAAVQAHQSVVETELPNELYILLGLPTVRRHGDGDRFHALGKRNCRKKRYQEDDPLQGIIANSCL